MSKQIFVLAFIIYVVYSWSAQGDFSNDANIMPAILLVVGNSNGRTSIQQLNLAAASLTLNNGFGRYWNIIVADPNFSGTLGDGVVFGYAFRSHWFWKGSTAANPILWIIWKDYNCVAQAAFFGSHTAGPNNFNGNMASASQVFKISSLRDQILLKTPNPNIWDNMVRVYDAANAYFQGSYTVAGIQYTTGINFIALVCTYGPNSSTANYGAYPFTTQGKKYLGILLGMSNTYGGDTPATKPTPPYVPSCLNPPHILSGVSACV